MKSKKIVSLFLALCMLFSMSITAFAEGESYSSTVEIVGTATESWTITVPEKIQEAGAYESITVSGNLPANKQLTISAPETITLTNERGNTYSVSTRFTDDNPGSGLNGPGNGPGNSSPPSSSSSPSFSIMGSDLSAISESFFVSVVGTSLDSLFGTFTGTLTYTLTVEEIS